MPLWLIFVLLSVIMMAGAEISQKISLIAPENISSETNNFVVWLIQAFFGFILFFLFSNHNISFPLALLPKLLVLGVIYFWGGTLYYSSYKGSSAGLSTILGTISIVMSTSLGIIFFHESTSLLKFIGILLVFLAIVTVKYSKNLHFDKYNWLAIAGGLLWGVAFSIDKSFVTTINPLFYLPIFCLTSGLFGLVFRPKIIISELPKVSLRTLKTISLAALFGVSFNAFTFLSYSQGGEVGRIDAINNSMIFLVIILEFFILKEKHDLLRKFIAASIAFAGIYLLALAK
ncbi:DMT family transporter [Candidatus Shapirobacteria bacterium]|nr:DMT family transporter [Candidatus Shapirobacteria bacterium]